MFSKVIDGSQNNLLTAITGDEDHSSTWEVAIPTSAHFTTDVASTSVAGAGSRSANVDNFDKVEEVGGTSEEHYNIFCLFMLIRNLSDRVQNDTSLAPELCRGRQ